MFRPSFLGVVYVVVGVVLLLWLLQYVQGGNFSLG